MKHRVIVKRAFKDDTIRDFDNYKDLVTFLESLHSYFKNKFYKICVSEIEVNE